MRVQLWWNFYIGYCQRFIRPRRKELSLRVACGAATAAAAAAWRRWSIAVVTSEEENASLDIVSR